ncbi:hypothetical protein SUGI_0436130 [Cryptomeria japonica]|nr:hypothetical protein SUGI_0436130 [Cryptomeria japonica]
MELQSEEGNGGNGDHLSQKDVCDDKDHEGIFTVDVSEESIIDKTLLEDLATICKFVGPKRDRVSIKNWIKVSWKFQHMVKFLPKGFFVVIFASEGDREAILQGGLWEMQNSPLYMQKSVANFDPLVYDPYDSAIWIRLYNLPSEYWVEDCLEKIERSLGTIIDIDGDRINGESYLYARIKIAAVRRIPRIIRLCVDRKHWLQRVEVEEENFVCIRCRSRKHMKEDYLQGHETKRHSIPKRIKDKEDPPKKMACDDPKMQQIVSGEIGETSTHFNPYNRISPSKQIVAQEVGVSNTIENLEIPQIGNLKCSPKVMEVASPLNAKGGTATIKPSDGSDKEMSSCEEGEWLEDDALED